METRTAPADLQGFNAITPVNVNLRAYPVFLTTNRLTVRVWSVGCGVWGMETKKSGYIVCVWPVGDTGRDVTVTACDPMAAARIAAGDAERKGGGAASYDVRLTPLGDILAHYESSGSDGVGYVLA